MASGNFYSVYIERTNGVSFEKVKETMNLSRSWYRLSEHYWILYTTSNSEKWYARLSPLVKDRGSLFICKLDMSENQGWIDKSLWDWIRKYSTV